VLTGFKALSFTALKTYAPKPDESFGHALRKVGRRGKHLLLEVDTEDGDELTFVVHLMQGGRLKPDEKLSPKPRGGIARWLFADGPAHSAAPLERTQAAKIPLDAVRDYASRAFRAGNAVLVVTGAIDESVIAGAVSGRAEGGPGDAPIDSTPARDAEPVQKDFYEPGLGIGWLGPPISDEREAAITAIRSQGDQLLDRQSVIRRVADAINECLEAFFARLLNRFAQSGPRGIVGEVRPQQQRVVGVGQLLHANLHRRTTPLHCRRSVRELRVRNRYLPRRLAVADGSAPPAYPQKAGKNTVIGLPQCSGSSSAFLACVAISARYVWSFGTRE